MKVGFFIKSLPKNALRKYPGSCGVSRESKTPEALAPIAVMSLRLPLKRRVARTPGGCQSLSQSTSKCCPLTSESTEITPLHPAGVTNSAASSPGPWAGSGQRLRGRTKVSTQSCSFICGFRFLSILERGQESLASASGRFLPGHLGGHLQRASPL